MNDDKKNLNSFCVACGAAFMCGISAGEARCWCMDNPVYFPVPPEGAACYCQKCLKEKAQAAQHY